MDESTEVGRELAGLRKEIYEARALIIKTDNLLKTFHLELKGVAAKQATYERRHFMGHVAAYVVIGVIAAGSALLYGRLAGQSAREQAVVMLVEARSKLERAESAEQQAAATLAARDKATAEASTAYDLLVSGDPAKQKQGLERVASIPPANLPQFARKVLETTEGSLRRASAVQAYEAGMADYRRGSTQAALEALERFSGHAARLPQDWGVKERKLVAYNLGAIYNQMGRHEQAAKALRDYLEKGGPGENTGYAYLLLGDSLQALGRVDEARKAFSAGSQVSGTGNTGAALRRRLAELSGQQQAAQQPAMQQPAVQQPAAESPAAEDVPDRPAQ